MTNRFTVVNGPTVLRKLSTVTNAALGLPFP
jgi:hypothetical protein